MDGVTAWGNPPRLSKQARLQPDHVRGECLLVYPERGLRLNDAARAVLELCDGRRDAREIAGILARAERLDEAAVFRRVTAFLDRLLGLGLLELPESKR